MPEQLNPKEKKRLIFIDVLRGISVLFMIEAHVLDSTLYYPQKTGSLYHFLNLLNGFISVSFLFCAGAAFWIASMRKIDDYRHFRKPLFITVKRLLTVLLIAYWLHLPHSSFWRMLGMTWDELISFAQVDILHTIAVSSLIALLMFIIIPNKKILPWVYLALAVIVFYITPFVWQYDSIHNLPPIISSYFAKQFISKFPLFPWSGYFFAGITLSSIFSNSEDKTRTAWKILFAGSGILIAALLISLFPFNYPGYNDWWYTSPGHAWFRLSIPVILFALLYLTEKYYRDTRVGNFLKVSGQESLFIYVGHLVIVYGSVMSIGLKMIVGPHLDMTGVFVVIIAIIAVFYSLAAVWHKTKTENPELAKMVSYTLLILFLVVFLLNPL